MIEVDDVIALLEPGPQTTRALAEFLEAPIAEVRALLGRMERAEVVKLCGEWTSRRWALAAWEPPAPLPKTLPTPPAAPGWWVHHAAPDQRDAFAVAARARDAEMRTDKTWRMRSVAFPKDPI